MLVLSTSLLYLLLQVTHALRFEIAATPTPGTTRCFDKYFNAEVHVSGTVDIPNRAYMQVDFKV
jgi:hypothetical protein